MTAQRIATNQVASDQYAIVQEAIKLLLSNIPVQRMIWACDICGMRYLGSVPGACDSCGSKHVTLQQDIHQEIYRRG